MTQVKTDRAAFCHHASKSFLFLESDPSSFGNIGGRNGSIKIILLRDDPIVRFFRSDERNHLGDEFLKFPLPIDAVLPFALDKGDLFIVESDDVGPLFVVLSSIMPNTFTKRLCPI